ncbi:transposase [Mesorhizobium amorphae]|uniref:transposase n=1 Tax=Mesorhizobium amorphae TaxID=71433 RepID=UPI001AEEC6CD
MPAERGRACRPAQGNRRYFAGMMWMARTGAQWRHLPAEHSKWNSAFSPISTMGRDRRVRDARKAGRIGRAGSKRGHDRQYRYPATPLCSRYKKGIQEAEALGRSRGGFTSKLHALCDAKGRPLRLRAHAGADP